MKPHHATKKARAFTIFEALVVIIVIGLLAYLLLPFLTYHPARAMRISCTNNLKQLGLVYKVWAGDNNDRFPMQISTNSGGSMEWLNGPDAWKTYSVMSNEMSTPKIVFCPEDSLHGRPATNFTTDLADKLSYFIGLDANDRNPRTLLAGDGNLSLGRSPVPPGHFDLTAAPTLDWDASRHLAETKVAWLITVKRPSGNLLLTDGSVQITDKTSLSNCVSQTGLTTNRLVIP